MQPSFKQAAAAAAIPYIQSTVTKDDIIGVGTGSTVNYFIEALASIKDHFRGAVASSQATAQQLAAHSIPLFELNALLHQGRHLPLYVDGADEIDLLGRMIKGGGAALTREKVLASVAERFVCIVDASKCVTQLSTFPLPVEVLPMAQVAVAGILAKLGATARLRCVKDNQPLITDNGCVILDVSDLDTTDPCALETTLNQIPGVLTVGLFAHRKADVCFVGADSGVQTHTFAATI